MGQPPGGDRTRRAYQRRFRPRRLAGRKAPATAFDRGDVSFIAASLPDVPIRPDRVSVIPPYVLQEPAAGSLRLLLQAVLLTRTPNCRRLSAGLPAGGQNTSRYNG